MREDESIKGGGEKPEPLSRIWDRMVRRGSYQISPYSSHRTREQQAEDVLAMALTEAARRTRQTRGEPFVSFEVTEAADVLLALREEPE